MSYMTNSTQLEPDHVQGETRDQSTAGSQNTSRPNYGGPPSGSSTSNFSTDSIAYHPTDLSALSAMIRSPTRGFYSGTSLLYSTSGFDMLGVIARVVTRPNPVVNLGPVDHSCSFVVVDPHTPDHEIVYCRPRRTWEYKNTYRSPGTPESQASCLSNTYIDQKAVMHFKDATIKHRECQVTLINYKNGGEPFLNLVTVVPITWDSDQIRYHVGFQADLVEAPRQLMENVRIGS
ncbi:unnamed protein product [Rhizoctonia solani]|uniref:PAS domain-containing protein n=1 Tax=Rhizoctonia solani TaxID=456999 RepID=A0A8H3DS99_9AGAM|nr:unnamed protein product [Rhizoctonia solani]